MEMSGQLHAPAILHPGEECPGPTVFRPNFGRIVRAVKLVERLHMMLQRYR